MHKPKKSLGQNFLIDKNIAKKIVNITSIINQYIIEIGPGTGFLTDEIIKNSPKMIYINTVNPGEIKGPHLHKNRTSMPSRCT